MTVRRRDWLALAAAAAVPVRAAADTEFEPLFDGRSLRGWTIVDGPDSSFYVEDGSLCVSGVATFPAWLRSERQFENFDFRGEFFIKGWTDSGIYFRAPEHGRPTQAGYQMKIFHQKEERPTPQSLGAIFPVVAPSKVNVREGWNEFRILADGSRIQAWINGELVQDVKTDEREDLRYKLGSGYLGLAAASAPCRYRNLRIRAFPAKEQWSSLYESSADLDKWTISEGKPDFVAMGSILRGDGAGHLATKEKFRDFELQLYIRGCSQHNGGVLFRSGGRGNREAKSYEIQLHNVEEAHFPTGSLYHHQRARYPRIEDEKWFLMQLIVKGSNCMVRVDGETILDHHRLDNLDEGFIELQTHRRGYWLEFKHVRIRPLR